MNYIASDTSKRKILSTRGGAEFSSGESAAGGPANPFPGAYFICKTNTHIVSRDGQRERRRE
jgi:hypothetical protein